MPHDRPADFTWEGIRDLTKTHLCRLGHVFHTRDHVGWGGWTPERFPRALAASMPVLTRSEMNADAHSAMTPMPVNIAWPIGLSVST